MHDVAGFFFTGAGTVPGFIFYADEPALAIMAMVLLLMAGCLGGMGDSGSPLRTAAARRGRDPDR
jgi:hypothetical protein